ncbi:DUF2806 domain-containing protein [Patescibacteria group bacterium]|nr:DUF2806 domain-containing protein [Patescibacteria group bacterium]
MVDPTTALTTAIENSTKVASTPLFSTVIDKLLGFKISEWKAQGDVIKKQILDGYEDAKQKGLGVQYVSAFRSNTNLINIGVKAADYIDDKKTNDISFENDFFWGMLDHAKDISNEEMQTLIAKIIAGEYNKPGTYSMGTLQVIKMLGREELRLFENLCVLIINGDQIPQELFSLPESAKGIMNKLQVDFGSLQMLQSLGLFLPNDMARSMDNPDGEKFKVIYFNKHILFEPITPENKNSLKIEMPGFYGLSPVGRQILQHLNSEGDNDYFDWLKKNYKLPNYKIVE